MPGAPHPIQDGIPTFRGHRQSAGIAENHTRRQIEVDIEEILDEAANIDEREGEENGPENRSNELPHELQNQEDGLKRFREAKATLEERKEERKDDRIEKLHERTREERETGQQKRGRKPKLPEDVELDDDVTMNVTHPEGTMMKSHGYWNVGYNGPSMVDRSSQVIITQDITTDANEK